MKVLRIISIICVALLAWVLGLKNMIEPDMWWYLRTGEWIAENNSAPQTDMFSFTFFGVEWINVKWLYELVVYWFSQWGGPSFTGVFQSLSNLGIVFVSLGIYKQLVRDKQTSIGIWAIVSTAALLISSYRMTSRPETISHLFSLLAIFIFLKGRNENRKWYFAWIPLQILWTNLHEAYATGIVIMVCLTLWELFLVRKELKEKVLSTPLLALVLSIIGVAVNPRGMYMLIHPWEIFRQLGENKFTTELYSWENPIYWNGWQSKAFVAFIALTLLLAVLRKGKRIKESLLESYENIGLGYIIVLVLMVYLGYSAFRNIPFFILLISPVLAYYMTNLVKGKLSSAVAILGLAIPIFAYGMIVSNQFYEVSKARHRYGLQVDATSNPIALSESIKTLNYKAPHFSDFLTSSYQLWNIKDYQSFIDLRDLDVFPESFFNDVLVVTQSYPAFQRMDSLNKFEYCYIKRTDFPDLIMNLNLDSNWKMVFADPIAALFVKGEDGVHQDIFQDFTDYPNSDLSEGINRLFNPLYEVYDPGININFMAAGFYSSIGDPDIAIRRLEFIDANSDLAYEALCMKAKLLDQKALVSGSDSLMNAAWNILNEAKQMHRKKGKAYFESGLMFFNRGNYEEAVSEFKISLKYDDEFVDTYKLLANCQNSLMQSDPNNSSLYTSNWFKYMEKAHELDPSDALIAYQIGVSYCERNNCKKAYPYLVDLGPLPYLSDADNASLMRCKKRCDAE